MIKLDVSSGNGVIMLTSSHFNDCSTKDTRDSPLVTFTYFLQSPPPSTVETIHEREKITFPYDMVRRGILTSTHIFLFGGYLQCLQPDLICISGTHCF